MPEVADTADGPLPHSAESSYLKRCETPREIDQNSWMQVPLDRPFGAQHLALNALARPFEASCCISGIKIPQRPERDRFRSLCLRSYCYLCIARLLLTRGR
jgi:hypothetical protein